MARKKDFLPIGTWVKFHKRVIPQDKSQTNGWSRDFKAIDCHNDPLSTYHAHFERRDPPVEHTGQIAGGKYLRRGVTDGGGYEDPVYFTSVGKSCFVYLVRVGFLNRPLYVLPEDVEVIEAQEPIPFSYQYFSEADRATVSKMMKEECAAVPFARDEKGRFRSILSKR